MKRFTFFCLLIFLSSNVAIANIDGITQITKDSSKCTDQTVFADTINYDSEHRLPKSDYPDLTAVKDRIEEVIRKNMTCVNDCTFPDDNDCKPVIDSRDFSDLKIKGRGKFWIYKGVARVKWHCSPCTEISNDDQNDKGFNNTSIPSFGIELLESPESNSTAKIQQIYPNPSTGIFYVDLTLEATNSEVLIRVSDLSGKMIREEIYQDLPATTFHTETDLSAQQNGLYFLSVYANEQLLSTSKVQIIK